MTGGPRVVDVALPVRDAEATLATAVPRLASSLQQLLPHGWRLTILDRASADATAAVARALAARIAGVSFRALDLPSRSSALRRAWLDSDAEVVACAGLDPGGPEALCRVLEPVLAGTADVAVGMGWPRGHCGVAALRAWAAASLLAETDDGEPVFGARLLWTAERRGLRARMVGVNNGHQAAGHLLTAARSVLL